MKQKAKDELLPSLKGAQMDPRLDWQESIFRSWNMSGTYFPPFWESGAQKSRMLFSFSFIAYLQKEASRQLGGPFLDRLWVPLWASLYFPLKGGCCEQRVCCSETKVPANVVLVPSFLDWMLQTKLEERLFIKCTRIIKIMLNQSPFENFLLVLFVSTFSLSCFFFN